MKTTSYEISKQLAEAGFKAKSIFGWHVDGKECAPAYPLSPTATDYFWSYDLETLLNALPKVIQNKEKNYHFWMTYSGSSDCWIMGYVCGIERNLNFEEYNEGNESLADTAARLLIKLWEKKLIKFEATDNAK
tara:strand:- start:463 stop:861 length:399 start_codon:yes stop_codon:yes gene_type:complete